MISKPITAAAASSMAADGKTELSSEGRHQMLVDGSVYGAKDLAAVDGFVYECSSQE